MSGIRGTSSSFEGSCEGGRRGARGGCEGVVVCSGEEVRVDADGVGMVVGQAAEGAVEGLQYDQR